MVKLGLIERTALAYVLIDTVETFLDSYGVDMNKTLTSDGVTNTQELEKIPLGGEVVVALLLTISAILKLRDDDVALAIMRDSMDLLEPVLLRLSGATMPTNYNMDTIN